MKTKKVKRKHSVPDGLPVNRNDVLAMLKQARIIKKEWRDYYFDNEGRIAHDEAKDAVRNFTALRGVVKALEWVINPDKVNPLD